MGIGLRTSLEEASTIDQQGTCIEIGTRGCGLGRGGAVFFPTGFFFFGGSAGTNTPCRGESR